MDIRIILTYTLPPLLGAVIGYVTNALAIRMLFRPLRKVYFLGMPLPLTPGIIPRQRENLAHSIARMVSRSLFNSDVIISHIRGSAFQQALENQIGSLLGTGEAQSESPEIQPEPAEVTTTDEEQVPGMLQKILEPLLEAPEFRSIIGEVLRRAARSAGDVTLSRLLPKAIVDETELEKFFDALLRGKGYRNAALALVFWFQKQARENVRLDEYLTPALLRRAAQIADRFYVPAVTFLVGFLRRPEIRRELVKRGKTILGDILLKLNPVQRIVISAGQYDRTLEEKMPGIVTDLIRTLEETLRDEGNRERIISAAYEFSSGYLETGLGDLEERYTLSIHRLVYRLLMRLRAILLRENAPAWMSAWIVSHTGGSITVDQLLSKYSGKHLEDITMIGLDAFFAWMSDGDRRHMMAGEISGMLKSLRRNAAGQSIDPEEGRKAVAAAGSAVSGIIEGAVPVLVERFDIYQMVVDRINALDIEEVEELLLGIIARHLKYINIFGALLGALIGGAQLIVGMLS